MKSSILFLLVLSCNVVFASSVILAWSPNQEPDLLNYRVYWGTASGQYSHSLDAGVSPQCELPDVYPGVKYYVAVTAMDIYCNESAFSSEIVITPDESTDQPLKYALEAIQPNPMHSGVWARIGFSQPQQHFVEVTIYNCLGQRLRTLLREDYPPGRHQIYWDGTDQSGQLLPSGIYYCRLQTGGRNRLMPFTILK
jgi:hypothetical protein